MMTILAFGAHPDDIEIGMGGSLYKFVNKGYRVIGIIATIPNDKAVRSKEAKDAGKILGIEIRLLDLDFNDLFFSRKIVEFIDKILDEYDPEIVFTHWNHDSHQDHNALTNGVIAATRKNDCSVYMYEQTVPGGIVPYSFSAQMYIDITEEIGHKINSIKAHQSQKLKNGDLWLQGVLGRAMFRGYQINTKYAEAFQVVKEINRI